MKNGLSSMTLRILARGLEPRLPIPDEYSRGFEISSYEAQQQILAVIKETHAHTIETADPVEIDARGGIGLVRLGDLRRDRLDVLRADHDKRFAEIRAWLAAHGAEVEGVDGCRVFADEYPAIEPAVTDLIKDQETLSNLERQHAYARAAVREIAGLPLEPAQSASAH